jgi:uracil-DNA glycosylase
MKQEFFALENKNSHTRGKVVMFCKDENKRANRTTTVKPREAPAIPNRRGSWLTNVTEFYFMADFHPALPSIWDGIFSNEYSRAQFRQLGTVIDAAYAEGDVYPERENIFRAFELVSPESIRVVIVGQDPYPTPGNAHGLSFSVMPPARAPRSLNTIFGELERSIVGWKRPLGGNLEPWARQGVLLLNSVLTVRARQPMSHSGLGWEDFTRAVMRCIQNESSFVVFLLWGAKAQETFKPLINAARHLVLECSHPSPMAQNRLPPDKRFIGNSHFVEANRHLSIHGRPIVDWRL